MKENTFILKNHWDLPQQINAVENNEDTIFSGREAEKNLLKNFVNQKQTGSILVCGHRGVGKTNLVYRAINELEDKSILPVIVNASHLLDGKATISELNPKILIEGVSRRLCDALEEANLYKENKEAETLYSMVSGTYEQVLRYTNNVQNTSSRSGEAGAEIEVNGNVRTREAFEAITKSVGVVATVGALNLAIVNKTTNIFWTIALYLVGLLAFLVPEVTWRVYGKIKSSKEEKQQEDNLLELTRRMDNSTGNIEEQLNKVLKGLSTTRKVIFIIDELDQVVETEIPALMKLIKFFKNLFAFSPALYIFITDGDFYETILKTPGNKRMYKTVFPDVMYLHKPPFDDIERYLREILEPRYSAKIDQTEWLRIGHFLAFIAKDDFFDLKMAIKDRLRIDDDGDLSFSITDFDAKDNAKIQTHLAIADIAKRNYLPELCNWNLNQSRLDCMYQLVAFYDNPKLNITEIFGNTSAESRTLAEYLFDQLKAQDVIKVEETDAKQLITWTGTSPDFSKGTTKPYPDEEKLIANWDTFSKTVELFSRLLPIDKLDVYSWTEKVFGLSDIKGLYRDCKIAVTKSNDTTHNQPADLTKLNDLLSTYQNRIKDDINKAIGNYLMARTNASPFTLEQDISLNTNLSGEIKRKVTEGINYVYEINGVKLLLVNQTDKIEADKFAKRYNKTAESPVVIVPLPDGAITSAYANGLNVRVNNLIENYLEES